MDGIESDRVYSIEDVMGWWGMSNHCLYCEVAEMGHLEDRNGRGSTALYICSCNNNYEVARLLLEAGAGARREREM